MGENKYTQAELELAREFEIDPEELEECGRCGCREPREIMVGGTLFGTVCEHCGDDLGHKRPWDKT